MPLEIAGATSHTRNMMTTLGKPKVISAFLFVGAVQLTRSFKRRSEGSLYDWVPILVLFMKCWKAKIDDWTDWTDWTD